MYDGPIVGIFLAAGNSNRMDTDKRALSFKGTTIGSYAFQTATLTNLDHLLVVTQKDDPLSWLRPADAAVPWTQIECPDASEGQSFSIKCGLRAAMNLKAGAVVIFLADQPCVTVDLVNTLVFAFERKKQQGDSFLFIAPRFQETLQPPILFTEQAFSALLKLEGDRGAGPLLKKAFRKKGSVVDWHTPICFYDIDTPLDYRYLLTLYEKEGLR